VNEQVPLPDFLQIIMDIRSRKIEGLIKEKLSALLLKGLKDPRLDTFITILNVELARDKRSAKVFVSIIGTDEEKKAAMEGLNHAKGYIQMRIGKEMKIKYIPVLNFFLDDKTEERVRFVHSLSEMERNEKETQ
jgi:ribosome-binding factor A